MAVQLFNTFLITTEEMNMFVSLHHSQKLSKHHAHQCQIPATRKKIKGLNSLPLLTVLSDMSGPTTHRAENGIGHDGLCLLDLLQLPGIMHLNVTIKESTRTNNTEVIHWVTT